MPKLRFKGPEPAYVTPLDRTVVPDEAVDVDDALVWRAATDDDDGNPTGYVWPEDLWVAVGAPKARTRGGTNDTDEEK